MRNKINNMSKKVNELFISLTKKIKNVKTIDSIMVFMLIIGYYDFGFIQCLAIIIYIVYKINSDKTNFSSKVAFS